jgi:ABC-type Mn2+/Zn2+ transport system permease subunit
MNAFPKALELLFLGALSIFLNGITGTWLWFWFLVPFGLPVIGILQTMGVSIALRFLIIPAKPEKSDEKDVTEKVIFAIAYPLVALGFGWLIHSFM